MDKEQIPFPKIDLFPRVTRIAHFLLDQLHHEGKSSHVKSEVLPDEFDRSGWTPVQQDAAKWMDGRLE
jgi:hypothetical protein